MSNDTGDDIDDLIDSIVNDQPEADTDEVEDEEPEPEQPTLAPVNISGSAHKTLGSLMRLWSGWKQAPLVLDDPNMHGAPAMTDHNKKTFTVNADALVRNPARVLNIVTPFRLRQEAVLTGVMLHEAGHARHSHWQPRTPEAMKKWKHGRDFIGSKDGREIKSQTLALARDIEEARIEGKIARDEAKIGAAGLSWTMRASAAALLPLTPSSDNPDQMMMNTLVSWVRRAGRQYAVQANVPGYQLPLWVAEFSAMVNDVLNMHLEMKAMQGADIVPVAVAYEVVSTLVDLMGDTENKGDTGTYLIDGARRVLELLFPETKDDEGGAGSAPNQGTGTGCGSDDPSNKGGQADAGSQGQGNSEPDDPGEGDDPGVGDAGQPDDQGENQPEPTEAEKAAAQAMADMLKGMEDKADDGAAKQGQNDAETSQEEAKDKQQGNGLLGGSGKPAEKGKLWREPTAEELDVQRNAAKFLRDLIEPGDSSKVVLSESPSSTVDAAALAAWKAGGQVRDPIFFKRTKRTVEPAPPVQIAVLVDVSSSMDVMQKPSGLLSWALTSACLDLRNFAGRGTQIESTMIHWGDNAKVIVPNGADPLGIYEAPCREGTSAMAMAMEMVTDEIPGFYDIIDKPVNRLLVQFTDWQLSYNRRADADAMMLKALEAGVNVLSVVPKGYSARVGALGDIMDKAARLDLPGRNDILLFDKAEPEAVWAAASETLRDVSGNQER